MITKEDIDAFADMHEMPDDWDKHFHTPLQMVRYFAKRMNQPLDQKWYKDRTLENLRFNFIQEEFDELALESVAGKDPENMLKEIADLVYVLYGYAATYGWDLDKAVRRVHLSNMSKLGLDGKPIKDDKGKVIKGPNYKKPKLTDLVE